MREFGWTPDELDAIPLPRIYEILTVLQAEVKHQNRPKKQARTTKTA